jgi:hypothetical protein
VSLTDFVDFGVCDLESEDYGNTNKMAVSNQG